MRFNLFCINKRAGVRYALLALVVSLELMAVPLFLSGCGLTKDPVQVVLTTGFSGDEVFRIETKPCTRSEVMIYLTNIQNRYENTYGSHIWELDTGDISLEDNIKDTVLHRLAQLKVMVLMAEKYDIKLSDEERGLASQAGKEYFESLTDEEKKLLGASLSGVTSMYEDYALADKVYRYIIKDVNPEISDDEARTITVQRILIKTSVTDEAGNEIKMDDDAKAERRERAQEVLELALGEEEFENLIATYNEGDTSTLSFGTGETEPDFEKEAFSLETNEVGKIVETSEGYNIIKCINTLNREETDANKEKIVNTKRRQVFGQEYSAFADTLTRIFNEGLWEKINLIREETVSTDSFFSVYNKYFDFQNMEYND